MDLRLLKLNINKLLDLIPGNKEDGQDKGVACPSERSIPKTLSGPELFNAFMDFLEILCKKFQYHDQDQQNDSRQWNLRNDGPQRDPSPGKYLSEILEGALQARREEEHQGDPVEHIGDSPSNPLSDRDREFGHGLVSPLPGKELVIDSQRL